MPEEFHQRRPRYSGSNPRRFEEKYKEHRQDAETLQKVIAAGKTPAGSHRPVMIAEVLEALQMEPGNLAVDATLGYGGHAEEILRRILPGGKLLGLDVDPLVQPKTEARLRQLGFGPETLLVRRTNFAGLGKALAAVEWPGADLIFADLGVSSMQIDDPARGFSVKADGPLDMRMNPQRGLSASAWLERATADELSAILRENSDEPQADLLGMHLAGRIFTSTMDLRQAVAARCRPADLEATLRRVFQALRIAVNDEFFVLESFLRQLPSSLNKGGRVVVLTFHSGEDRRVKKAFKDGLADGSYSRIARNVVRATPAEIHSNPRASSAKLRWAIRSSQGAG